MSAFPTAAIVSDPIAKAQEKTRGILALVIVGLLVAVAGALLVYGISGAATNLSVLMTGIFTPIIGIVGTVLGFYFGSQNEAGK